MTYSARIFHYEHTGLKLPCHADGVRATRVDCHLNKYFGTLEALRHAKKPRRAMIGQSIILLFHFTALHLTVLMSFALLNSKYSGLQEIATRALAAPGRQSLSH